MNDSPYLHMNILFILDNYIRMKIIHIKKNAKSVNAGGMHLYDFL